jgi:hypothetical protein
MRTTSGETGARIGRLRARCLFAVRAAHPWLIDDAQRVARAEDAAARAPA